MSEKTFRAIVAAVLVGALVLAAIAVLVVLQPASPSPSPGATAGTTPTVGPTPTSGTATPPATLAPTPTPTPTPTPPAFGDVRITGGGDVPRGGTAGAGLVLRFVESAVGAIPDAAGSFTVTLADSAGVGTTLAFTGTPVIDAPGSLGVTAALLAGNVLQISIVASDRLNIEPITVTGLAIRATPSAALGPIDVTVGAFTGSLAGGMASPVAGSPGTVVANP